MGPLLFLLPLSLLAPLGEPAKPKPAPANPPTLEEECARAAPVLYLRPQASAYASITFAWRAGQDPAAVEKGLDPKGRVLVQVESSGCTHETLTLVLPFAGAAGLKPEERAAEAARRLRRIKARRPRGHDAPRALASSLDKAVGEGQAAELGKGMPRPHGEGLIEVDVRKASGDLPPALTVTYDVPL